MAKYKVSGTIEIGVSIIVSAKDEESAQDKAFEQFDGLELMADNSIGSKQTGVELEVIDSQPEFYDVEEEEE